VKELLKCGNDLLLLLLRSHIVWHLSQQEQNNNELLMNAQSIRQRRRKTARIPTQPFCCFLLIDAESWFPTRRGGRPIGGGGGRA